MRNLTAIPAPILEDNVDTDVIFPARFLLLLERAGLGRYAFFERRAADKAFPLDAAPWQGTSILVGGQNFGTGSSREQAVWSLADLGIRCVIAPSFGEIFFANCFRNGVLPIVCVGDDLAMIEEDALEGRAISVDLETQRVTSSTGVEIAFEISPHRKAALLAGLDEVSAILKDDIDAIASYEASNASSASWKMIQKDRMEALRDDIADGGVATIEKGKRRADAG